MSVAVAAPTLFDQVEERFVGGPVATASRRPTLDSLIVATWSEIRVRGAAACPLCGGEMQLATTTSAPVGDVAAVCGKCRTEIS